MKEGKLERNIMEHNFMKFKFTQLCFDVNIHWCGGKIYPESRKIKKRDIIVIFGIVPYKKTLWPAITQEKEVKKKQLERGSLENHRKHKKFERKFLQSVELNTKTQKNLEENQVRGRGRDREIGRQERKKKERIGDFLV